MYIHILDLKLDILKQIRRVYLEFLQHVMRLFIDLSCSSRNIFIPRNFAFQVRVCNSRADGIRIWILMSHNVYLA